MPIRRQRQTGCLSTVKAIGNGCDDCARRGRVSPKPQGPTAGFVEALNANSRKHNPLGLSHLNAKIGNSWLGEGRKKRRFAEVVQAMIRAHPDAPVAPVLIEKPRGVGG